MKAMAGCMVVVSICLTVLWTTSAFGADANAIVLSDGTIVAIGYCDFGAQLKTGQSQVNLGPVMIPENSVLKYMVKSGALVPRQAPLTQQQYQDAVFYSSASLPAAKAHAAAALRAGMKKLYALQARRRREV